LDPVIQVRGLRFQYAEGVEALAGVDFQLHPGECVALFGANGSGKTTFLLHLAGLLRGAGRITVAGLSLGDDTIDQIRDKVGFVFQDSDDQLFMPTVYEDVAFGPLHRGCGPEEAERRAASVLQQLGISHLASRAPYHLSAGEKKRAALAGVLAMRPEVLIFDEPTTYLDPPGQRELVHLLRQLPQARLIATHDMWFARQVASRAVFFSEGTIAGEGTVDEIAERFEWRLDAS
jgi:cobalt/nickel transport system ATP-binding protein